jgi:HK97 gp10 family phage protein
MSNVELKGLDQCISKMTNAHLLQKPLKYALDQSAETVQRKAMQLAPVSDGYLKTHITTSLDGGVLPLWATVGSNTKTPKTPNGYGECVEYGTRPHWPPVRALEGWAKKHHVSAWAVAVSISKHGTRAQPFMRPALQQSTGKIQEIFRAVAREVQRAWASQAS